MSFSNDINLAWYGGNQSYPLFQQDIADFLDYLSESFKLIMVGGSGGGFAALAISSLMKRQADILVFNPQTSISEYGEKHVLKYLETAFPEAFNESFLSDSKVTKKLDPYLFREFLETTKIVHDVTNVKYKNKRIIYLQNRSDHHLKKHAWPFFKFRFMLDEIKNIKTSESDEHCVLHLGDWGAGHVAPPVALIDKCTNFLASGVKLPLSRLIYEANL